MSLDPTAHVAPSTLKFGEITGKLSNMAQATPQRGFAQEPERAVPQDRDRMLRQRFRAGLKQKQAAAKAGISASLLCRMEKGKIAATADKLHRLAQAYGCEVEDLMSPLPATQTSTEPSKAAAR